MVHLARRVSASSQLLPNVHVSGALWRAAVGRRAGNSGARCGLMLPASKAGTLSVAVVARHVVMRPSKWVTLAALFLNGQAIQPRLGGAAAACLEGDAVCGTESLISKWH